MNKKDIKDEKKVSEFKLPRYLRLAKGTMFFDTEGEDSSGVRIYSVKEVFVGREIKLVPGITRDGKKGMVAKATDIPKDKHGNKNLVDYGKVDGELPWYIDTTKIENKKLSRIITAFKYGILVEADPNNPPEEIKQTEQHHDFQINDKGDRIFAGRNKEMFMKLQNMNFNNLRDFITTTPKTSSGRDNLMDLYNYELKGHNPLNRPRLEVIKLLKAKLKEYGPGISSIRINEDE